LINLENIVFYSNVDIIFLFKKITDNKNDEDDIEIISLDN